MLHITAVGKDMKLKEASLQELKGDDIKWYWVDFDCPTDVEVNLLESFFNFHPLAIEDCIHHLQRPKLDRYEDYNFLVAHSLNQRDLSPQEVDIFVGKTFIVTFHKMPLTEIDTVLKKVLNSHQAYREGAVYIQYEVLDQLVDNYFPAVYEIEDYLNEIGDVEKGSLNKHLINKVFETRNRLHKLRRVVYQMRDLLYKIVNSENIQAHGNRHVYFTDVYDHLLRLSEFVESSLLVTSDLRESYVSMNSDRMNRIMMLFTAITTVFVPLTFIVGVYGMNFDFMPELRWKYGYFLTLVLMGVLAVSMLAWFKKKGWFDM